MPLNEADGAEAKALAARALARAAAAVASSPKAAAYAAILAAAAASEAESELASERKNASNTPFPLPAGAVLSKETCLDYADIGATSATGSHASTDGIVCCIAPSHTLSWTPSRKQWGLVAQACLLASTQSAVNKALCFHIVGEKPLAPLIAHSPSLLSPFLPPYPFVSISLPPSLPASLCALDASCDCKDHS